MGKRWLVWDKKRISALTEAVAQINPHDIQAWAKVAQVVDDNLGHMWGTTSANAARSKGRELREGVSTHMPIVTEEAPPEHEPIEDRWAESERVTALDLKRHTEERRCWD